MYYLLEFIVRSLTKGTKRIVASLTSFWKSSIYGVIMENIPKVIRFIGIGFTILFVSWAVMLGVKSVYFGGLYYNAPFNAAGIVLIEVLIIYLGYQSIKKLALIK